MIAAPGWTVRMSSWAVSGFMQIKTPISRRRAMKPSLEARTVNQVGRPWMLEGKRFLPETANHTKRQRFFSPPGIMLRMKPEVPEMHFRRRALLALLLLFCLRGGADAASGRPFRFDE